VVIDWSEQSESVGGVCHVARAKQPSKRKRRSRALPALGAAGLSFSLASGASAAPAANIPTHSVDLSHEFILAEEEVSDVSLATFYVFDKVGGSSGRRTVHTFLLTSVTVFLNA
jgi:hypothetical protein